MERLPLVRIATVQWASLSALGLTHLVVIAEDVSIRVVGAIESAHRSQKDAETEARRLSTMYGVDNAFIYVDLGVPSSFRVP